MSTFSVSFFKSPFWRQAQHWSLLTSLVCLKNWPCRTFSFQSSNLYSFFDLFKTLAAFKPSILSPLAACINLCSLSWTYTSKPLIANSTQSSMNLKPLPASCLDIYNLSTADLECNTPYMVNSFLVFLFIACSSLFQQLTNAAEYYNRDTAQVLTPRTKFWSFNFDFKTFLILQTYSFETCNFIFPSKNLCATKIRKYL